MPTATDPQSALAMLKWLAEAGADEALHHAPVDRAAWTKATLGAAAAATSPSPGPAVRPARRISDMPSATPLVARADPPAGLSAAAATAREIAAACTSLEQLRKAVSEFDGCALRMTASNTVFADGPEDAPVMLIGEAPGREEDIEGRPFVGRSGQLLDKMLNEIGLDRARNAYITNVVFWRPPGNRTPAAEEVAVCLPFLLRHIELKQPRVLVLLGATPVRHVLNIEEGITRARGKWGVHRAGATDIPALATFHPAYLLRAPGAKRQAWQDFLNLKIRLRGMGAFPVQPLAADTAGT